MPFARSSLNHDDIFVLDTKSTIFQFNGEASSIQERGKALEVVQYIKDTHHEGKCEVIIIGKELDEAVSFSISKLNQSIMGLSELTSRVAELYSLNGVNELEMCIVENAKAFDSL